ncbi:MAG: thioredoxin family protein [Methanolinea tarda]|nr:thioredoxin family protein [Methanolinea sp.]HQJ19470.1 thioredoxin family protein [Methanolinea sp.]
MQGDRWGRVLPPGPSYKNGARDTDSREAPMGGDNLVEVTDSTFEKTVEKSSLPVLVMFYSPTCVHCRAMEPHVREYAEVFAGRVLFARLDVIAGQWTAERYGVRSTPTFKFFCSGRPILELVGAVYPALLKRMVEDGLQNGKECVTHSTAVNYDITGYA